MVRKECGSAASKAVYKRFWKRKAKGWVVQNVKTIRPARKTFPGRYCVTLKPKKK